MVSDLGGSSGQAGAADEAFVPSDIDYVDTNHNTSAHIKLLAATMELAGPHPVALLELQNVSETKQDESPWVMCNSMFTVNLYSGDSSVSSGTDQVVGPLFSNESVAEPCLGIGDVGYAMIALNPSIPQPSSVTRLEYLGESLAGGDNLPKITNVDLGALSVTNGLVSGSMSNHGTTSLPTPAVYYFAVAADGRPTAFDAAEDPNALGAGETWDFALPNTTSVNRYALFVYVQ